MLTNENCTSKYFRCLGLAALVMLASTASASAESIFYSFMGGSDGDYPSAVIADAAGNLLGTTELGGNSSCGCGTVFKIAPDGTETILYAFQGGNDGSVPNGALVEDGSGNLFGVTSAGGGTGCNGRGCGTVFEIAADGTERVVYAFQGGSDGYYPTAPLSLDGSGNLYGTTVYGGNGGSNCVVGSIGCGTVFQINASGTETVLYAFQDGQDGAFPNDGLVADGDGNLYGAADQGGDLSCAQPFGCGVIFKIAPSGSMVTLYAFPIPQRSAAGPLSLDHSGNVYATTMSNEAIKVSQAGVETVLHQFGSPATDGFNPLSGLINDEAGDLYGTTTDGGSLRCGSIRHHHHKKGIGCGTVFKLKPDGTESLLYIFLNHESASHGVHPYDRLLLKGGFLYGAASGGAYDDGVIFKLKK